MFTICNACGQPKECVEVHGPCHDCSVAIMEKLRDWARRGGASSSDTDYLAVQREQAEWEDQFHTNQSPLENAS